MQYRFNIYFSFVCVLISCFEGRDQLQCFTQVEFGAQVCRLKFLIFFLMYSVRWSIFFVKVTL